MRRAPLLLNLRFGKTSTVPPSSTVQMPTHQKPIRFQTQMCDCPTEITSNIVRHMDSLSSLCFALTSRENHGIVKEVKQQTLKALAPPSRGPRSVKADGTSEHEQLIRQLWVWLGGRCAFCGVTEKDASENKDGYWTYSRHICRGWLRQSRHKTDLQQQFDELRFDVDLLRFEFEISLCRATGHFEADLPRRISTAIERHISRWRSGRRTKRGNFMNRELVDVSLSAATAGHKNNHHSASKVVNRQGVCTGCPEFEGSSKRYLLGLDNKNDEAFPSSTFSPSLNTKLQDRSSVLRTFSIPKTSQSKTCEHHATPHFDTSFLSWIYGAYVSDDLAISSAALHTFSLAAYPDKLHLSLVLEVDTLCSFLLRIRLSQYLPQPSGSFTTSPAPSGRLQPPTTLQLTHASPSAHDTESELLVFHLRSVPSSGVYC